MIAIGELRAKRIGPKTIRIQRDSLLELGDYRTTSRAQGPIRANMSAAEGVVDGSAKQLFDASQCSLLRRSRSPRWRADSVPIL